MIVVAIIVTAVCASAAPFKELPPLKVMALLTRKIPSALELDPKSAA